MHWVGQAVDERQRSAANLSDVPPMVREVVLEERSVLQEKAGGQA